MGDEQLRNYVFMFIDVVRYSTLSSEEQLELATRLSRLVPKTLLGKQLEESTNGVFLPTGDGFALGFLDSIVQANPKYALDLACELQQKLQPRQIRIGLHVGTAQPYADFNARFFAKDSTRNNIAGPGINVSQRVMNLGDAGDILASGEFVRMYHDAAPDEAEKAFHYLGRLRVKHGLELDIHKYGSDLPPTRIKNYTHAQTTVKSLLRRICDAAVAVAHPSCRESLDPRASVLAYDPVAKNLYVSTSRFGYGMSDPAERSKARFLLNEGPGRTFTKAIEGPPAEVHHIELPDPAVVGAAAYADEMHAKTAISRSAIKDFKRKARLYVYFPILHGTDRRNVLGVLSLDTLSPLLNADQMRRQLTRRAGVKALSQQAIEAKIERSAQKHRKQLNLAVQEWLRQLSEAWALLMHY